MGEARQGQYQATIRDLEEQLTRLLGQGSEVDGVMSQLKQAEQHVTQVEGDLQELQVKVGTLQHDKVGLEEKLKQYRGRLDEQEKCLALTRDEREELLQLKPKAQAMSPRLKLTGHLKLAEMAHESVHDRPKDSHKHVSESSLKRPIEPILNDKNCINSEKTEMDMKQELYSKAVFVPQSSPSQTGTSFESKAGASFDLHNVVSPRRPLRGPLTGCEQTVGGVEPVTAREQTVRGVEPVTGSEHTSSEEPVTGSEQTAILHQFEQLKNQISEVQDENDVLKYELTQKCHDYNSDTSDSEDAQVVELHETCEHLRERVHGLELSERQLKDRLRLAEHAVTELEANEAALRDHREEDRADKEKLKKQIVRLQKKIRDLKDVISDKEQTETALNEKVTCLVETETFLAQKLRELEQSNQELQQRLDLQDDLVKDVQLLETINAKVVTLERENNELQAKMIDLEEDNEVLSDNWKKVADEEANRRECLEEKIKVLQSANHDLKAKLHEKENDIDLNSSGTSIASEINNETIEQLKGKVKDLEAELQDISEEKNEKIEELQEKIGNMRDNEVKLSETLSEMEASERNLRTRIAVLEKSEHSQEAATTMLGYVDRIQGLKSSQGNLLERLDSMEDHEDDLKQRLLDMEKMYERKLEMLEREIAEYQQQEDDLCARIGELDENESKLNNRIDEMVQNETLLNEKIEELENSEVRLRIQFSNRVEELKNNENVFNGKVQCLEVENSELKNKVSELEKHEHELSEKVQSLQQLTNRSSQEHSELLKSSFLSSEAKVEIASSVQNVANLEKESSACLILENQKDSDTLTLENQNLQEKLLFITNKNIDLEKEQKVLNDRLKKQEKKVKKSQRQDNVEDYDTIARQMVTYRLEVDQLRAENNDLHERIMELDDSENELLEKNETLSIDLKHLNEKIYLLEESEDRLKQRINELESVEVKLKEVCSATNNTKINSNETSVRQPSIDSAYESGKECAKCELIDKMIGTDDYMEGVMPGNDHSKPVSSMFERIQALETNNQELTSKLATLTATDSQVRQLSEKVKSLEENEDCLMERVMELEDIEDQQRRELSKLKQSANSVMELEDELVMLQENEKELGNTIEKIEMEKINLEEEKNNLLKGMESSYTDKSDLAMRLAFLQKQYDNEKKKVETFLSGEEKWMKTVASEKKQNKEMEDELEHTQQKLEDLQTDYENKLSEKDESEKQLQEEFTKQIREKEYMKKKLQEYEKSNSELEDEIEACKISESRMFHRHQQLISQNEELEAKVAQLVKLLPMLGRDINSAMDGEGDHKNIESLMSDNPEVVSENPLTASVFSEDELQMLRSQDPDTELLGSVPLDMLRKMKEFDERETNYQAKIDELENKNIKLLRKSKVLQGREKDLKHEMKDIQLELLKVRESSSSLRASTSSLDFDKSLSDNDSDNQSVEELDSQSSDVFNVDGITSGDYKIMSRQQLLLAVKLFEQKQAQETEKHKQLEDEVKSLEEKQVEEREMATILEDLINNVENVILGMVSVVTEESFEAYLKSAEAFIDGISPEDKSEEMIDHLIKILEFITGLRQRFEALHASEEQLRLSLAESQIAVDQLVSQSAEKVQQLESQVHVLAKLSDSYPPTSSVGVGTDNKADIDAITPTTAQFTQVGGQLEPQHRLLSRARGLHLETSKTINIDVPPVDQNVFLGISETIKVNVPPANVDTDTVDYPQLSPRIRDVYSPRMMDKAEDVLRQRIRELEKLEKHLRQQVLDLEQDRDELHDIARKDKTLIHEQNVRVRELQLAERNLQQQLKNFETNENTLYARVDDLESDSERKDDRIRDLEILEGRLKELVKKYKLDEKLLQTKSQSLESSVHEMTVKEETMKQKLQNLESEKTAFSERSEYLQMRLKELENAEADLAQRTKNQENVSQSLQNTVRELEVFGANAQARVVELEAVNLQLMQRLHQSMSDNSPISHRASELQQHVNGVNQELVALRDSDVTLKQANDELQKERRGLQEEVKSRQLREVELNSRVRELEEAGQIQRDKLSKLQRMENTLKYRVQELEGSGIQAPGDLTTNQLSVKLPRTLEDCQRRIIVLQAGNAELQSRLQQYQGISGNTESNIRTEVRVCGKEVESEVLEKRLSQTNKSTKMLENQAIKGQWDLQGPNLSVPQPGGSVAAGRQSTRTREDLINDLVGDLSTDGAWVEPARGSEVHETLAKKTIGGVQSQPPRRVSPRDRVVDELMQSLEAPGLRDTEDRQWRSIEFRAPEADSRGSEENWINVGTATRLFADNKYIDNMSHENVEEIELALTLQSETESQGYSQNDTESRRYGNMIAPATVQRRHEELHTQSMHGNSGELRAPPLPQTRPPEVKATDSFGESAYLPSSVQDSMEEISEPGCEVLPRRPHVAHASAHSIADSIADSGRGTASVSMTTSGLTLRERIANIEKQLSARESDSAKDFNSEIDLTSWKAKVHESNRRSEVTEKENKYLKDEINKLEKDLEEKTRVCVIMNAFLLTVDRLLADMNITSDRDRMDGLSEAVTKTKADLANSDHRPVDISGDPAALSTEMARSNRELAAKRVEVGSLTQELRQWQQECRSLEDMRSHALDSLRTLEMEVTHLQDSDRQLGRLQDDHNTLRRQVSDGESVSKQSPPPVAPLRARIVQLSKLCNEKDVLIKKLVQELKRVRSGSRPSPLLEELCRLETEEDHNHNEIQRTSSLSSLESADPMAYLSDTELIRGPRPTNVNSPTAVPRPRSADYYHRRNSSHRSSSHLPHIHSNGGSPRHRGPVLNTDRISGHRALISPNLQNSINNNQVPNNPHFVAIADYDPMMFSQSGRQRLELSLMEGDNVVVTGPLDQTGYYEAEVNGCVGLVPASHIQPSALRRAGKQQSVPGYLDPSPERITQLYNNLQKAHRSDAYGHTNAVPANGVSEGPTTPRHRQLPQQPPAVGPPDIPSNFHVDKVVGNSSLMLSWQQLPLDDRGCSNGVKVTGYRIYKDNKVLVHPCGAHQTKVVIENVDIHAHHRFGIRTVSAGGRVSALSEVMYEGVEVTSDENSDTESEMDMAAVIDQDEYKTGHKRMFMGVYDYDPTKHSPQDHPTCELTFSAGDIISVYGRQRADGFYNGEINGIRGLVPAFFIEEMPQAPPRSRKTGGSRHKHAVQDSSDSLRSTR